MRGKEAEYNAFTKQGYLQMIAPINAAVSPTSAPHSADS